MLQELLLYISFQTSKQNRKRKSKLVTSVSVFDLCQLQCSFVGITK